MAGGTRFNGRIWFVAGICLFGLVIFLYNQQRFHIRATVVESSQRPVTIRECPTTEMPVPTVNGVLLDGEIIEDEKSSEVGIGQCGLSLIDNPTIQQNDPRLISYIRNFYLTPPATRPYALNLAKDPKKNPSEYADEIMNLFKHKKNGGFFIEAGANDGEYLSNTLQLEREYHWTGLLIEPNPFMLAKLRLRYRKAWIAGLCLSLEGFPQKIRFVHRVGAIPQQSFEGMGIIEHSEDNPVPPQTKRDPNDYIYAGPVECFPLYSILLAMNQTVIDYFSMDIEGIELRVLKAIPFDLLTIKVFSIEYTLIPEGEQVLTEFLESKGYVVLFKKFVEMFVVHKDYLDEFKQTT